MTHASSRISGLRSVALNVPDITALESFFTDTWRLEVAARQPDAVYLRGSGADHHLLSLHHCAVPACVRHVTLRARALSHLHDIGEQARLAGGRVLEPSHRVTEPGGGVAIRIIDPHGRVFQIVHGDSVRDPEPERRDGPIRLAHAVLNSHDAEASRGFMESVFDFSLSDRTKIMAFMRCNDDHHSIAFGDTDNDALNHIAFLMPDLDSVMRGGGRLRDAGFPIEWGPGRHGPGNNAFNYFVGPFDIVIEYTAEVQRIDDSYLARGPADWKWPPGRVDQWGISAPPSDRLKAAQRAVHFAKSPNRV